MKYIVRNPIIKISLVFVLFGMSACTKYKEGPKISFRDKEKLLKKNWYLIDIKKNHIPYYNDYVNSTTDTLFIDCFLLENNNYALYGSSFVKPHWILGKYEFITSDNLIRFSPPIYSHVYRPNESQKYTLSTDLEFLYTSQPTEYKILRLTKTNLVLQSINLPDEYKFTFYYAETDY